jgi:hypothetical protein
MKNETMTGEVCAKMFHIAAVAGCVGRMETLLRYDGGLPVVKGAAYALTGAAIGPSNCLDKRST